MLRKGELDAVYALLILELLRNRGHLLEQVVDLETNREMNRCINILITGQCLTLFLVLSPAAILVPSLEELGFAQCSSVLRSSTLRWRELSSPGNSKLLMPLPPAVKHSLINTVVQN